MDNGGMSTAPLCSYCGAAVQQKTSAINRAHKEGRPLYCNRTCAGLARRLPEPKTPEQKKEEKRQYDAKRRAEKHAELCAKKRADYYANHERRKAEHAAYRAKHMDRHVAYCRQPEYKAKKTAYDRERRLAEYGPFADAVRLLEELEAEIRTRASAYEIRVANGYYTRNAQKRRRELWLVSNRRT